MQSSAHCLMPLGASISSVLFRSPSLAREEGRFRFVIGRRACPAGDGLHHRNEADGEQRQATDVKGGQDEPVVVDGIRCPDLGGPSGKIHDQVLVGDAGVLLDIRLAGGGKDRAHDDFLPSVVRRPRQRQLLITEEDSDGQNEEQQSGTRPGEGMSRLGPPSRGEEDQAKHHRYDELP